MCAKCVPNLKPALCPKLQDEQCGLLQKDWGLYLSLLSMQCPVAGSLLRTIFQCHSPMDPDSSSLSGHQGWVIKGCPLGFRCKNWVSDTCKAPLQETLVLWSAAEGEYKDSAHSSKSSGKGYSEPLGVCLIRSLYPRP